MEPMIATFARQFDNIDAQCRELLDMMPGEKLFTRPVELNNSMAPISFGEFLVRSSGMVEQTMGGITRRLWDDPFEWTLPEALRNRDGILEYFDEVRSTRMDAFSFIRTDSELFREMPSPIAVRSLADIFIGTIARSHFYLGEAAAIYQIVERKALFNF
jgi:hypothetical protein